MARQNLNDILGKSGDFQFSFAVEDLITPAIEDMDKAANALMKWFNKSTKLVSKKFNKAVKALRKTFKQQSKEGKRSVDKVGDAVEDLGKDTEKTDKKMVSLTQSIRDLANSAQFREGMENFFDRGSFAESAKQFNSDMVSIANTLGKSRKEVSDLTQEVIRASDGTNKWSVSAQDSIDSVQGLVEAGVRNKKMLKDLAPLIAITSNAVGADKGGMAASFYELNDRMGISGPRIAEVMMNWKKTSELAAVSFDDMKDTFTDPAFNVGFARLTQGATEDTKVQVMKSLGQIRGSFKDIWAESDDFIQKIVGSMTNPEMAAEMQKLTGMAAHDVKAMLQTTEGTEQFFTRFMDRIQTMGKGSSAQVALLEKNFGFAEGALTALNDKAGTIRGTFKNLQGAQMGVNEAMKHGEHLAYQNLFASEKLSNFFSKRFTKDILGLGFSLADVFTVFADIPFTEIFAFMAIMGSIAGTTLPAFLTSATLTAAGVTTLGGAFTFAAGGVWAMLAPILLIGAKVALVVGVFYAAAKATEFLVNKLFEFEAVQNFVVGAANAFEALTTWMGKVPQLASAAGTAIKDALKGAFNNNVIKKLNEKLSIRVPLTGKTLGEMVGFPEIPELYKGGVVMGPTIAKVAEVRPEVVMPLDKLGEMLSQAGYSNAAAMVAPTSPGRPTQVNVPLDRVVNAVLRLEKTVRDLASRQSLPTRGSGFGNSSAASPRSI